MGVQVVTREVMDGPLPCSRCDGSGSLKAAALAMLRQRQDPAAGLADPVPLRCEDCGHPMGEGTWEGDWRPDETALAFLRDGEEPMHNWPSAQRAVHYSPCDEDCRHGGPLLVRGVVKDTPLSPTGAVGISVLKRDPGCVQASWRQVDARTLGWPHDLRSEKLAVLCLRCYAQRHLRGR